MGLGHGCNYLPKLKMAFQTAQNWKILSLRERGERLAPVFSHSLQFALSTLAIKHKYSGLSMETRFPFRLDSSLPCPILTVAMLAFRSTW